MDQSLTVTFRQQVSRGDPLVMAIHLLPTLGAQTKVTYQSDHVPTVAGRRTGTPEPPQLTIAGYPIESDETAVDLPGDLVASLKDGPQSADVTVTANVQDGGQLNGPSLYRTSVTLHGGWTLMPASSPSLTIDTSVQKAALEQMARRTAVQFAGNGDALTINADFYQWASYPFAFRVYVRGEGREWEVCRAVARSGKVNLFLRPFYYAKAGFPLGRGKFPPRVDVIIRPNEEDAVRTIDCTRTWRGDVVVPDVPVQ